jgi:hypothetical protein
MKIAPHETELVGQWIVEKGEVSGDDTCKRIRWLTAHHLRKISISKQYGAWETLFQDPDDGRYWEQTYPRSGMHGGGPPLLRCLTREEAKDKYGNEVP